MSIQRLPRGPDQGSGLAPRSRSNGSSSSNQEEQSELSQDLELLWKQKWVIVGIAALMVALAALFTFTRVPIYTATAKVLVKPTGINLGDAGAGGIDKLVSLPTEAELVQSTEVAALAAPELGTDADELLDHVSVSVPTGSQLLEVKFSDPDPERAAAGAEAVANAYLVYKQTEATRDVAKQMAGYDDEIANIDEQIAALGSTEADVAEKALLESRRTLVQLSQAELLSLNTNPGTLVSKPEVPTSPSSPNKELNLALGLFAGLFIGVGVGLLRARLGSKLEGSEDLEDILQVPVLAVVPRVRAWRNRSEPRLETILDPHGPAAEAYRALRPVLMAAAAEQDLKIFMVVSPSSGEGKTTTASNLAVVLAQAEQRVALVSADLRRSRAHEFFGIEGEPGLTDVLDDEVPWREVIVKTSLVDGERILVIPSGRVPSRPADLLQSKTMEIVLQELRASVDFVIIDSPPILAVSDALGLVSMADGLLFVADARSTKRSAVAQARRKLAHLEPNIIGAVLNDQEPRVTKNSYGYGYDSNYVKS